MAYGKIDPKIDAAPPHDDFDQMHNMIDALRGDVRGLEVKIDRLMNIVIMNVELKLEQLTNAIKEQTEGGDAPELNG